MDNPKDNEHLIGEIDLMSDENTDYSKVKEPIEDFTDFSKAKKSKFYDLYLEMSKFIDHFEQI